MPNSFGIINAGEVSDKYLQGSTPSTLIKLIEFLAKMHLNLMLMF